MIRTISRFVRGTAVALALCSAPLYSAAADTPDPVAAQARSLDPGEFVWKPERAKSGPVQVVVSLPQQRAYVYRSGTLIGVSTVSSGKPGHGTPPGTFPILQKKKDHRSNKYNDAPMPYMQRLTWSGVALHGGNVPGYPASHGCIRLPTKFAKHLFGVTELGSAVVVTGAVLKSEDEARILAEYAAPAPAPA